MSFPGQMNRPHKSWVQYPLWADKLNKVTPATEGSTSCTGLQALGSLGHSFMKHKQLAKSSCKAGETRSHLATVWKLQKGLRLIDHLECHSLVYKSWLGWLFWSAVVSRSITFDSMYVFRLLKWHLCFPTAEGKTWLWFSRIKLLERRLQVWPHTTTSTPLPLWKYRLKQQKCCIHHGTKW